MSRTKKDMPHWVHAEWYEPWHCCRQHRSRHIFGIATVKDCNLPAEPVRRAGNRWDFETGCHWTAVWGWHPYHGQGNAPKWYRDHAWTNRVRTQQRAELGQARKEWAATGEVDVVPSTAQHRHCASWMWW